MFLVTNVAFNQGCRFAMDRRFLDGVGLFYPTPEVKLKYFLHRNESYAS